VTDVRPAGVVAVVGGGATNVKSTVALNLALALANAASAPAVTLADLDGAARLALRLDGAGVATVPWSHVPLRIATSLDGAEAPGSGELVVVDPPPRFGPTTERALALADVALVPVDASPLAARVLAEVAGRLRSRAGEPRPPRLRVVLARRLPRSVDRWGLVDRIDELAPGGLLVGTLPMARPQAADPGAAVLYSPGTAAERAYAVLSAEIVEALGTAGAPAWAGRVSTTP